MANEPCLYSLNHLFLEIWPLSSFIICTVLLKGIEGDDSCLNLHQCLQWEYMAKSITVIWENVLCIKNYLFPFRYLQVHPTPMLLQNSVKHQPCFSLQRYGHLLLLLFPHLLSPLFLPSPLSSSSSSSSILIGLRKLTVLGEILEWIFNNV